jgi:acyl-CoA synthetase (NDP forming)
MVTFMGQELVQSGLDILNKNQVATSYFPEAAARALGALKTFHTWLQSKRQRRTHYTGIHRNRVAKILAKYRQPGAHILPMPVVFEILKAYGLPVIHHWLVTDTASAEKVTTVWHGPMVLKINSPDINHKSDVGGVVLNVSPPELATECTQLVKHIQTVQPEAKLEGVMVMPMQLDQGLEVILGVTSDVQLGKQIVVGLGGIYAEVLQDVSWGLAPLTAPDIDRMLAHLKIAKILAGWRGQAPLAIEAVAECLGRLSQLVTDFPIIKELDINPLKVLDQKKGAVILDARIIVGDGS